MRTNGDSADQLRTIGRIRGRRGSEKMGALYYVSFGEDGPIKIGYVDSFTGLRERLRGLQTACPYELTLLATKAGSKADERDLHIRFAKKRLRGEWFKRHRELMAHIRGVQRRVDCQKWMPRHTRYLPAPEGKEKLWLGKKLVFVTA